MKFRTHTGQYISGKRLKQALLSVAEDYRNLAHAIRKEDAYASHVIEREKEIDLTNSLRLADRVAGGEIDSFTTWQRVNEKLTGECVAFLSK